MSNCTTTGGTWDTTSTSSTIPTLSDCCACSATGRTALNTTTGANYGKCECPSPKTRWDGDSCECPTDGSECSGTWDATTCTCQQASCDDVTCSDNFEDKTTLPTTPPFTISTCCKCKPKGEAVCTNTEPLYDSNDNEDSGNCCSACPSLLACPQDASDPNQESLATACTNDNAKNTLVKPHNECVNYVSGCNCDETNRTWNNTTCVCECNQEDEVDCGTGTYDTDEDTCCKAAVTTTTCDDYDNSVTTALATNCGNTTASSDAWDGDATYSSLSDCCTCDTTGRTQLNTTTGANYGKCECPSPKTRWDGDSCECPACSDSTQTPDPTTCACPDLCRNNKPATGCTGTLAHMTWKTESTDNTPGTTEAECCWCPSGITYSYGTPAKLHCCGTFNPSGTYSSNSDFCSAPKTAHLTDRTDRKNTTCECKCRSEQPKDGSTVKSGFECPTDEPLWDAGDSDDATDNCCKATESPDCPSCGDRDNKQHQVGDSWENVTKGNDDDCCCPADQPKWNTNAKSCEGENPPDYCEVYLQTYNTGEGTTLSDGKALCQRLYGTTQGPGYTNQTDSNSEGGGIADSTDYKTRCCRVMKCNEYYTEKRATKLTSEDEFCVSIAARGWTKDGDWAQATLNFGTPPSVDQAFTTGCCTSPINYCKNISESDTERSNCVGTRRGSWKTDNTIYMDGSWAGGCCNCPDGTILTGATGDSDRIDCTCAQGSTTQKNSCPSGKTWFANESTGQSTIEEKPTPGNCCKFACPTGTNKKNIGSGVMADRKLNTKWYETGGQENQHCYCPGEARHYDGDENSGTCKISCLEWANSSGVSRPPTMTSDAEYRNLSCGNAKNYPTNDQGINKTLLAYPVNTTTAKDTCCVDKLCADHTCPNRTSGDTTTARDKKGDATTKGHTDAVCCCPADKPNWFDSNHADWASGDTAECRADSSPPVCQDVTEGDPGYVTCSGRGELKDNKFSNDKPSDKTLEEYCCCPQLYDYWEVTNNEGEGNPWECKTTCNYGNSQLHKSCSTTRVYNPNKADTKITETQISSATTPSPYDQICCADHCERARTRTETPFTCLGYDIPIPNKTNIPAPDLTTYQSTLATGCCKDATCSEWIDHKKKSANPNELCTTANKVYDTDKATHAISGDYSFDYICCKTPDSTPQTVAPANCYWNAFFDFYKALNPTTTLSTLECTSAHRTLVRNAWKTCYDGSNEPSKGCYHSKLPDNATAPHLDKTKPTLDEALETYETCAGIVGSRGQGCYEGGS